MSFRRALIGLLLAAGLATGACAAPKPGPSMHCRHSLVTFGSADGLPPSIATQLRPWMALHGEHWNRTDSISRGDLTAGFLWAARWNSNWLVAFTSGGIACCNNRLGLFLPAAPNAPNYHQVLPKMGGPDLFGDVSCKGVDAVLDAYAGRR